MAIVQRMFLAAIFAVGAASAAVEKEGMEPLQHRIQGIDHTLDGMLVQLHHDGSTGYWRLLTKRPEAEASGAPPSEGAQAGGEVTRRELQKELVGMDGKFDQLVTNLEAQISANSGSNTYWQRHAAKSRAPTVPVNMVVEAQGCLGDARSAVSLAAVQMSDVNKAAFAVNMVAERLDAAEEKLECALRRLSKLGADDGSSGYWRANKDDMASDSGALFVAWILGGFLVAGSVALLSEVRAKAQRVSPDGEGPLVESLL